MKRFVFRLQTLLDHRVRIEEMRMAELAALRMNERKLEAELGALREACKTAWEALAQLTAQGARAHTLAQASAHCQALADDIKLAELSLEALRRDIAGKLEEVIRVSKERKVIEQLRDRHRLEHEAEQFRLAQKELDDMTAVRHGRDRL